MVKNNHKNAKQITSNCPVHSKNCNFEPFCTLTNCVLLRKEIGIPYVLMVLLSIPFNKLPCSEWSLQDPQRGKWPMNVEGH